MWKAGVVGTKPPFNRVANVAKLRDQVEIVAVCDLNEEWASQCAEKFGIEHVFTDMDEMLASDIDIVYVFTGTYARLPLVTAAASAGKHIFTEKPLALSLDDGQAMIDAVREAQVKYQIGYQLRTYYFARALKALVDKGVLGEITSCMSRRFMPAQHWKGPDGQPTWYGLQDKSGGITIDYITHDIDLMNWIAGRVTHVSASIRRGRCKTGDDNVWSVLDYENGAMGMIGASFSATFPSADIGIFGTDGSAVVTGKYQGVAVKLWGKDESSASEYVDVDPQPEDVSVVQHLNFLAALAGDREPSPSIVDGYRAIEVALAMQESARIGLRVELAT